MSHATGLRSLAARDLAASAPHGFDEFEIRAARASTQAARHRHIAMAATCGALGVVILAATLGLRLRSAGVVPAHDFAAVDVAGAATAAESWFAASSQDPVVVSAATYASITVLEDRIAWIDDRLNESRVLGGVPRETAALDGERERLLRTLAYVRRADALTAEFN